MSDFADDLHLDRRKFLALVSGASISTILPKKSFETSSNNLDAGLLDYTAKKLFEIPTDDEIAESISTNFDFYDPRISNRQDPNHFKLDFSSANTSADSIYSCGGIIYPTSVRLAGEYRTFIHGIDNPKFTTNIGDKYNLAIGVSEPNTFYNRQNKYFSNLLEQSWGKVAAIEGFIKYFQKDTIPLNLKGHSAGAMCSLTAAIRNPDSINKLELYSGPYDLFAMAQELQLSSIIGNSRPNDLRSKIFAQFLGAERLNLFNNFLRKRNTSPQELPKALDELIHSVRKLILLNSPYYRASLLTPNQFNIDIIYGNQDQLVSPTQSINLYEYLLNCGWDEHHLNLKEVNGGHLVGAEL